VSVRIHRKINRPIDVFGLTGRQAILFITFFLISIFLFSEYLWAVILVSCGVYALLYTYRKNIDAYTDRIRFYFERGLWCVSRDKKING